MSAVFTGNGLGLFNTSLSQLGTALGGNAGIGQGRDQQYVNLATGNLVWQGSDEHLVFRGLAVGLTRTYNSLGQLADVGADGWMTGFERRLSLVSGTFNAVDSVMRRYTGDGAYQDFTYVGPNEYRSTAGDGAHDTLTWTGDAWLHVEGTTRRQEQYANHADATLLGRLTHIRDLRSDGTTPVTWQVVYDVNQRIAEIRADDGTGTADALLFGYDGSGQLASIATREAGNVRHQVTYGYDAQGRLASVLTDLTPDNTLDNSWDAATAANNDGRLFRTEYTYVGTGPQLASVRQSDGTLVSYTYHADGRLKTVTRGDSNINDADGAGETTTYSYDSSSTTVSDSLGRSWVYGFDPAGQLVSLASPPVEGQSDVTTYQYDAEGNVTQVSTVRGATVLSQVDYAYDAAGNVIWEWDGVGNAISRTWSATNQLSSLTRYTGVDPDRTGAELPTGGMTTNYVYDAQDRLRFVVDALGQVSEFTYATSGNAIGQQSSLRQYLGASYTGAHDIAGLQAWATTTQKTNSQLSELTYDAWGRLSQRIDYAAVDATGVGTLDAAADITRYTYDAQGTLRQQIALRGTGRTANGTAMAGSEQLDYVYDGMGRLLSTTTRQVGVTDSDQSTIHTTYAYLDSGHQVAVTDDAGRLVVQTRDAAGRVISVSEQGTTNGSTQVRTQVNYYDAAGQLRANEDAAGGRTYFFYDTKGRLEATVDATGAISRSYYDGADRLLSTRQYANRLTTSGWLVNGQIVPVQLGSLDIVADAALDRVTTRAYDAAGRLQTQTDGLESSLERAITIYSYDGAGRLIRARVTDAAGTWEKAERYFYDDVGRQTAVLDAANYLTESQYDRAGRLVAQTRYSTRTYWGHWAEGSLDELRPDADVTNDQTTRYFYNGRGQQVGVLDAQGYLSEWIYDEAGNTRAERRYAAELAWSTSDTLQTLRSRAGAYREQRMAYNALGQVVTQTNAEGTVTRYVYDEAGRLTTTQTAYGSSEIREGHLRYNVFGELVGELSGESALQVLPGMSEAQLDAVYAQHGVRHTYDALGRRIESIDSAGGRTWYFYDAMDRQTFVVRGIADSDGVSNALGEVAEQRYNAFGQISEQISYTDPVVVALPGSRESALAAISVLSYLAESADSRRLYAYTARGQLASFTDAEGSSTQYQYDALGQLTRRTQASGTDAQSVSDYSYDVRGNQILMVEGVGTSQERESTQLHDAFGRVVSSTDMRGSRRNYSYDRLGRQLTSWRSVGGGDETTAHTYDAYGRILSVLDANSGYTSYSYDDSNRSLTVTSPEGVVTTTSHNRHGQIVRSADAAGYTEYTYNLTGQLVSTERRANDGSVVYSELQEHDAARGLLTATIDGSGRRVEIRYDAIGRVLERVVDPQGVALTTQYRYDGQGRVVNIVDANGRFSEQRYDREGRLVEITKDQNGLHLVTQYGYDAVGRQISMIEAAGDASARITRYLFDALGRRTSEIVDARDGGLELTTSYAYDENDNVVRRTDANGSVTRFYYDEANQLTHQVNPLGEVTRYWYDNLGRQVATRTFSQVLDPSLISNDDAFDDIDQLLTWNDDDGGEYRAFDGDGNLRFVATLAGNVTDYKYDGLGRLASTRSFAQSFVPEGYLAWLLRDGAADINQLDTAFLADDARDQRTYLVYDALGQQRFSINALGEVTQTMYDRSGLMVGSVSYSTTIALTPSLVSMLEAGTATPSDIASVVATASNDQSSYQVYDGAGRSAYLIDAAGIVVERVYDAMSRVVQTRRYANPVGLSAGDRAAIAAGTLPASAIQLLLLPDGQSDMVISHVYDTAGREVARVDGMGTARVWRYDALGQVVADIAYDQPFYYIGSFHEDVRNGQVNHENLDSYLWGASEQNPRASYHFYDAAGRRVLSVASSSVTTERYGSFQVNHWAASVTEWRYDGTGRILEQISYGVPVQPGGDFERNTIADVRQRIANASSEAGNPPNEPPSRSVRYVYDAAGRARFVIGADGSVTENRYNGLGQLESTREYGFVYDPPELTLEQLSTWFNEWGYRGTRNEYDTAGRVVAQFDAAGNGAYYEYDGIGRLISSQNRLGYVWRYEYDNAGRRIAETSPEVAVSTVDSHGVVSTESRSLTTRLGYDSFGNVVTRIEDSDSNRSRITTYVYDVRGNQIRTIFPDAGILDVSGNLVATGQNPTTEVTYDALGRAVMQKDARGYYSHKIYDAQDRVIYDVDQQGYVTEYAYNVYGEQTRLRRLAQPVQLQTAEPVTRETLEGLLLHSDSEDRIIVTEYDKEGRKSRVVQLFWTSGEWHAFGETTQYHYNAFGDLVSEKKLLDNLNYGDDTSTPSELGYSSDLQLNNYWVKWASTYHFYDAAGMRIASLDPEGYKTTYVYDNYGQLIEKTEFARRLENYDPSIGELPPDPLWPEGGMGHDRVTMWQYDALGRRVYEWSRRGGHPEGGGEVVTYTDYDNEGRVTSVTVNDNATRTAYDALGRAVSVTESERMVIRDDAAELLLNTSIGLSNENLLKTISPFSAMTYDAFGNMVQLRRYANGLAEGATEPVASSRDSIHTSRYDWQGRSIWEKDATGAIISKRYDAADNILSTSYRLDGNNGRSALVTSEAVYDRLGRQVSTRISRELFQSGQATDQTVVDSTSQVRYNAFGEIIAKDSRLDASLATELFAVQFVYDSNGRLVQSNADGTVRTYRYNAAGHQIAESHMALAATENGPEYVVAETRMQLDKLGRVIQQWLPSMAAGSDPWSGPTILRDYDRWGNVVSVTDQRGFVTRYEYDQFNQLLREVRPTVRTLTGWGTEYEDAPEEYRSYDNNGNLKEWRDFRGNMHRNEYDQAGRLVATVDANGSRTHYAYDAFGQLRLTENAIGHITFTDYDAAGRVTAQGDYLTTASGTARSRHVQEQYVLNQQGNRLQVIDALGNRASYDYDSRGLVTRSRTAAGVVMEYAYDSQGNKIRETNALSDTSLFSASQPMYRGGIVDSHFIAAGQSFSYVVPTASFTAASGEVLTVSARIEQQVNRNGSNVYEATAALAWDAATGTLSGTALAQGNYRITLVATSSTGQTATAQIAVTSLSQAVYDANFAGRPVAQFGLFHQQSNVGQSFSYQLPTGAFVDPQGQPLTYTASISVWVQEYDAETNSTYSYETHVDLPLSPNGEHWLAFDPNTRTLYGTPPRGGTFDVYLNVRDSDGNVQSLPLLIDIRSGGPVAIANGGFESGAIGWDLQANPGAVLAVAAGGYSSGNALRLTGTGESQDGSAFINTAVAVVPGQSITANAMVKMASGTHGTSYSMVFIWYDAAGNEVSRSAQTPQMRGVVGSEWRQASYTSSAPAGAASVKVGFYLNASASTTSSVIWVDNVSWNLMSLTPSDGRARITDDEGDVVFLDEQTWKYDYFGRLIDHNDLSGADYDYEYDSVTGQLISQSSNWTEAMRHVSTPVRQAPNWLDENEPGWTFTDLDLIAPSVSDPSRQLSYYANGQLKEVREGENWTRFAYDAAGNRTMEETWTVNPQGQVVHLRTLVSYDSHNRITQVTQDDMALGQRRVLDLRYDYDAAGNRRRVMVNSGYNPQGGGTPSLPTNLNFEQGDLEWSKGNGWSINFEGDSDAFSGSWSASYTGSGNSSLLSEHLIPVVPGDSYATSVMIQSRRDSAGELLMLWLDADGNLIRMDKGNQVKSGNSWKMSNKTATAPAGAVSLRIGVSAQNDAGEGPVLVDQFEVTKTSSGGNGGTTPVQNWESYWYTYDAENRVTLVNGKLANGVGVLGDPQLSYALSYDAAGRPTHRRFVHNDVVMEEITQYDERGQRTAVFQARPLGSTAPMALQDTFTYDAMGRQTEHRQYFGAGSVYNGVDITGWLRHAEVTTYDADGRVTNQQILGRALGWTAPTAPPPPDPPPAIPPGHPMPAYRSGYAIAYPDQGIELIVPADAFTDPEGQTLTYSADLPSWLQYQRLPDGSHRFYGTTPNQWGVWGSITLTATDSDGHSTSLGISVEVLDAAAPPGATTELYLEPYEGHQVPPYDPSQQILNLNVLSHLAVVDYGSYGYDAAGRLRAYSYTYLQHEAGSGAQASDPRNYTHRYSFQYEGRDSYLEKQVYGNSTNSNFRASSSVSSYDAWGRRVAVRETTPKHGTNGTWLDDRVRYFAYDGESNILQRREGTVTSAGVFNQTTAQRALDNTYTYVGGQQVASGQRSGKVDVLSRLTAYDSSDVGTVGVTVQTGDTLRGIAQRVYGNSNLWYVLAQANAIETDADLVPGTSLKVPEVKVTANDANTFKPFNPGEAIGNTAPSLPYIEPPPQNNCNVLAAVVMIVIAVVVTYFTAGAASTYFAGVFGSSAAGTVATGVAAGAVAGAAGAAASGAAGSAMGAASFSWRNVAAGAVSGAVTGGVVGAANAGALGETLQSASWARAATFAVAGNVASYGANKMVGNQASFSWRSVAASAVSGAVTGALTPKLGEAMNIDLATTGGQAQTEVLGSIVGGVVGAHTRRALLGEDLNYGQIVMDAFGNALGNALSGKYSSAAAAMRSQGRAANSAAATGSFDEAGYSDAAAAGWLPATAGRATGAPPLTAGTAAIGGASTVRFDPNVPTLDAVKVIGYRNDPYRSTSNFAQWQWTQDHNRWVGSSNQYGHIPSGASAQEARALYYQNNTRWHQTNNPAGYAQALRGPAAPTQTRHQPGTGETLFLRGLGSLVGFGKSFYDGAAGMLSLGWDMTLAGPGGALMSHALGYGDAQRAASGRLRTMGAGLWDFVSEDGRMAKVVDHFGDRLSRADALDARGDGMSIFRAAMERGQVVTDIAGLATGAGGAAKGAAIGVARVGAKAVDMADTVRSASRAFDGDFLEAPQGSVKPAAWDGIVVNSAVRGAVVDANFAQPLIRADRAFSEIGQQTYSRLSGTPIKTVDDLAAALQRGEISPSQVPLDFVDLDGARLILNTRTSTALRDAGIPKADWFGINRTGQIADLETGTLFDDLARAQLQRNVKYSVPSQTGWPELLVPGGKR